MSSFVPSAISQSFFELQTPDFAWKFVWTVWTNFDKIFKKQNGRQIAKLSITRSFLELQSPDFAWKFVWTVRTNFDFFLNGRQKTKWPPNHKIEHNSLVSWATESIFCMEVRMDSPNKFWKFFEIQNGRQKQNGCQISKLSITRSFLELQSPDFAWKFVWAAWLF